MNDVLTWLLGLDPCAAAVGAVILFVLQLVGGNKVDASGKLGSLLASLRALFTRPVVVPNAALSDLEEQLASAAKAGDHPLVERLTQLLANQKDALKK